MQKSDSSHDSSTTNPASRSSIKTKSHYVAGLLSGTCSAILLQPLDLLKTRIQQSPRHNPSHSSQLHNPLRQTVQQLLSSPHPIRSLWRGTVPSVIRTGAGSSLYFGLLHELRSIFSSPADRSSSTRSTRPSINLSTGALSRVLAGLILSPITVLKVRFESSHYRYTSIISAGKDIVKRNGYRGFFAGFGATALRDAPYAGIYVATYESFRSWWSKYQTKQDKNRVVEKGLVLNFSAAVVAATAATAITNPFDAIKTRIQLLPDKYGNMFSTARQMLREEGVRSMFDGLGLRMVKKGLSSALAWTVYEELVKTTTTVYKT